MKNNKEEALKVLRKQLANCKTEARRKKILERIAKWEAK
jgi:hypothetical protein